MQFKHFRPFTGPVRKSQAAFEGSWHLFRADEKPVGRHRAGEVGDLAPAEAEADENEGGGPGLEADELGREAQGWRSESGSQQGEALGVADGPTRPSPCG